MLKIVSSRVEPGEYNKLVKIASREKVSVSKVIHDAIKLYLMLDGKPTLPETLYVDEVERITIEGDNTITIELSGYTSTEKINIKLNFAPNSDAVQKLKKIFTGLDEWLV